MIFNSKPPTREERIKYYEDQEIDHTRFGKVRLKVDDQVYLVDTIDAYDCGKPIRLPDGRVFQVGGWFESMPPQPAGVTEIKDLFAETLDCTLAEAEVTYGSDFAP